MLAYSLEKILKATTVDQIRHPYLEAMASYGFETVFYAARFMLALPSSLAQDHAALITTLPDRVLDRMRSFRGHERPIWAQWVSENDGDISSDAMIAQIQPAQDVPMRQLQLIRETGIEAAQIISLRDKVLRSAGVVVVNPFPGASYDDLAMRWQEHGSDIRTLCWVTHMRIATMPATNLHPVLTPRQREVLEWRSAGKTVAEIATILGVTPATVEKHMRLAREALGVQTTPQAILKAHLGHELFQLDGLENPLG
jgi:LuxR family transcriptional regulator